MGTPVKDLCLSFPMNIWTSASHVRRPIIPWTSARGSINLSVCQLSFMSQISPSSKGIVKIRKFEVENRETAKGPRQLARLTG